MRVWRVVGGGVLFLLFVGVVYYLLIIQHVSVGREFCTNFVLTIEEEEVPLSATTRHNLLSVINLSMFQFTILLTNKGAGSLLCTKQTG